MGFKADGTEVKLGSIAEEFAKQLVIVDEDAYNVTRVEAQQIYAGTLKKRLIIKYLVLADGT